jgi:hypothetical protein
MNRSLIPLGLAVLGLLLPGGPRAVQGRIAGGDVAGESMESRIAENDVVFWGVVVDVREMPSPDPARIVMVVKESIKGPAEDRVEFVNIPGIGRDLQTGEEGLVFLVKQRKPATGLELAHAIKFTGIISSQPVPTMDLRKLIGRDDILQAARVAAEFKGNDQPTRYAVLRRESWAGPGSILTSFEYFPIYVPIDSRLEKLAREWIRSDDAALRSLGVRTLAEFRSPQTIELLKALCNDSYQSPLMEKENRWRVWDPRCWTGREVEVCQQSWWYPVRETAYRTLSSWGVDVPEPVITEPAGPRLLPWLAGGAGGAIVAAAGWLLLRSRRHTEPPGYPEPVNPAKESTG